MKKGKLILICGLPGSGKTTLSKELSEALKTIRLCPDEWVIELGFEKQYLDAKHRPRVEAIQWSLACQLALAGSNVVLENGYWKTAERISYIKSAREQGLKIELHFLDADLDTLQKRITNRNKNLPKHSLTISQDDLKKWYEKFEAPDEKELKMYNKYKIYK